MRVIDIVYQGRHTVVLYNIPGLVHHIITQSVLKGSIYNAASAIDRRKLTDKHGREREK